MPTWLALAAPVIVGVGMPAEDRSLPPLSSHDYTVEAPAGTHRIVVRHRGADAVLQLARSGDDETIVADVANILTGEEYVVIKNATPQQYQVTVSRDHGDEDGSYSVAVEPITPARSAAASASSAATAAIGAIDEVLRVHEQAIALWQPHGAPNEQARLHASIAARLYAEGKTALASDRYQRALQIWAKAGQPEPARIAAYWYGVTLAKQQRLDEARIVFERLFEEASAAGEYRLAFSARNQLALYHMGKGDFLPARQVYAELIPYLQQHGLAHQLATAYHNVASTYYERGDPTEAERYFKLAIETAREQDPQANVAAQLEELGGLYALKGRCERAFDYLHDALTMLRTPSPSTGKIPFNKRAEGRILNRIGNCHRTLGELSRAQEFYERSLALRVETEDERGRAYTLSNLGDVMRLLGNPTAALAMHEEAATSHEKSDDKVGLVTTLIALAEDYADLRQFEQSYAISNRATAQATQHGYAGFLARALKTRADALAGLGESERALAVYDEALGLHQRTESAAGELETLTARAQLLARIDRYDAAASAADKAIALGEGMRGEIGSADLRARFLSVLQRLYVFRIGLLLAGDPDETSVHQSLRLNDQRRSRVLREHLVLGRGETDEPAQQRHAALRAALNAKLVKREQAHDRGNEEGASSLAGEISALRIDLLEIERDLSSRQLQFAEAVRAPVLDIAALQSRLSPDTLLLDFALGPDTTHVWLITGTEIRVESFDALPDAVDPSDTVAMQRVLEPFFRRVAQRYPHQRRLIVVPDGVLSLYPLAGIEHTDGRYLVDRFILSIAPSLALAGSSHAPGAIRSLALVGNPAFRDPEPPVSEDVDDGDLFRSMRGIKLESLPDLPFSGYELERIEEIAGSREVLVLNGHEASKARVLSEATRGRDVIHFATHGFVNSAVPELSGLVLALVDADGNKLDGFLRLADVYNLREIGASLVVLSGCRTGSGLHVRGEGAMSLARAFMQNGVEYVLASQWNVPDRATAELMIAFYRALLDDKLTPEGSLAHAQREIKRRPRFRDPRNWAGFSLWQTSVRAN